MREIGGYIELDTYQGNMLHSDALKLNCAKNCLAFLIVNKSIKRIYLPYFLCDSIAETCLEYGVDIIKYHIDINFMPILPNDISDDSWLYLVNFYGQLPNEKVEDYKRVYKNIILDNVQDYFREAIDGVDTFYSCRKFFGVADGAILYSDLEMDENLEYDVSHAQMGFLLGRYEGKASDYYQGYVENNKQTRKAPIMRMSRLTENLLHAIDYQRFSDIRTSNFQYLHETLEKYNMLDLHFIKGAFAYPLYCKNGQAIRKRLIENKIYIPILWPNVIRESQDSLEGSMAANILPLPVDQRYGLDEMRYVTNMILQIM